MKKIIGLTGEIGAGKDVFCEYVQKTSEVPVFCLKFSNSLSEVLKIFFDEISREDQQWLGIKLRERFGNDILAKAMKKKINGIESGLIILNGIRYMDEFDMIKSVGGSIVYVTADSKIRWERLQSREEKTDDQASYDKFLELSKAATELTISKIGEKADYIIDNNGSLEDCYRQIQDILDKI